MNNKIAGKSAMVVDESSFYEGKFQPVPGTDIAVVDNEGNVRALIPGNEVIKHPSYSQNSLAPRELPPAPVIHYRPVSGNSFYLSINPSNFRANFRDITYAERGGTAIARAAIRLNNNITNVNANEGIAISSGKTGHVTYAGRNGIAIAPNAFKIRTGHITYVRDGVGIGPNTRLQNSFINSQQNVQPGGIGVMGHNNTITSIGDIGGSYISPGANVVGSFNTTHFHIYIYGTVTPEQLQAIARLGWSQYAERLMDTYAVRYTRDGLPPFLAGLAGLGIFGLGSILYNGSLNPSDITMLELLLMGVGFIAGYLVCSRR